MRAPAFLAEMEKAKLDVDAVSAEEIERIVQELFRLPPASIARLKQALGAR